LVDLQLPTDWQTPQAYACGGEDGIANGGGERRDTRLAHALRIFSTGHDVNFDFGRLVRS
jgi:hypothetical protein